MMVTAGRGEEGAGLNEGMMEAARKLPLLPCNEIKIPSVRLLIYDYRVIKSVPSRVQTPYGG